MHQDTTWYGGKYQTRRHCVSRGPSPPPLNGHSPNFRPMSIVANRLDGLRCRLVWGRPRPRRVCVRWGPSSLYKKGESHHPIFGPCILWPNGSIDKDATWYEVDLGPGHVVLDGVRGPSSPAKGAQQSPSFWPMSIVDTIAHLSYC